MDIGDYQLVDPGVIIVFVVIGFIVYKIFSGSKSKMASNIRSPPPHDRRVRKTGRGRQTRPQDQTRNTLTQTAKRQERLGNLDEASSLYLRGGQVFSAAKMVAMKGPHEAPSAIEIIQVNAPDQVEMISQNLINEFYYRLNQPATAAALLHGIGRHDEAVAVEVAANITPYSTNRGGRETAIPDPIPEEISEIQNQPENAIIEDSKDDLDEITTPIEGKIEPVAAEKPVAVIDKSSIPKTLMMASSKLAENCGVCRRAVVSGDSFIYCLNCGKPGHYKHLAEIMKVTGKCPSCKEKLRISMYDL